MITLDKPTKLNGLILIQELEAVGLSVQNVVDDGKGSILLDLPESAKSAAQTVINNHKGEDTIDPKIAARKAIFEKLGLTEEEAVILLG
jgi:hypothetical protein